jgi:hypothetical protein
VASSGIPGSPSYPSFPPAQTFPEPQPPGGYGSHSQSPAYGPMTPTPPANYGQQTYPPPINYGQQVYPQEQQQPPYYPGSSSPYYYNQSSSFQQPGAFPQEESRRKLSRGAVIAIVSLAVLTILAGTGILYYTFITRPEQIRADATATAQVVSTANTRSTATAHAQATGTVQAQVNATATVRTQATAGAKATATALQAIYTDATKGPLALNSSMAFQDSANWEVYDAVGGGGCAFTGGALHASVLQKNFYVPCFAKATNFGNMAFEVQMTILKGDEGGLIFRADNAASKFYYFRIGTDGIYSLSISKSDKQSSTLIYDNSPAIKTAAGQVNTLTVIARGKIMYLYINKQFIASASDSTYSSGSIGVFAGDVKNPTDVAFQNARVWSL